LEKELQPVEADAAPTAAEEVPKGIIRGKVTYPWGIVKDAKVAVGEKTALSDSSGNYEIAALEPGSYNVVAEAPFPGYEVLPQTVEIEGSETKVLDIYFDFKKATVEGHVHDQEGKAISGATLSGVLSGKDMESVKTDQEGYFRFSKVTPGGRFMRVNAQGFLGETRDFKAVENQPTTLEFRLTPATCKVSGTITDTEGNPLGAEVLLLKGGIVIEKTRTNAETGHYEFPAVPARYEILPIVPGYSPRSWSGEVKTDVNANFSLMRAPEPQDTSDS
jgi:protocatechuate 3,4-dioxygenase beta subunit